MTMANRHRRKKQKAGEHAWVATIAGKEVLGPQLEPAAVAPDDNCPW